MPCFKLLVSVWFASSFCVIMDSTIALSIETEEYVKSCNKLEQNYEFIRVLLCSNLVTTLFLIEELKGAYLLTKGSHSFLIRDTQ